MRMDEFLAVSAERFGLGAREAEEAVAHLLGLVNEHVGGEEARAFIHAVPDAEHLLATVEGRRSAAGLAALARGLDLRLSGRVRELKALGRLARLGLPPEEVGIFVARFAEFAAANAGTERTERVLSRIPGLENFF
ncbi:MAG: hypothetical protein HXY25_02835 [Alphaproteobacteria bacterium]|nr:hypothetical protein [Alphaproteobacteria bacterium]